METLVLSVALVHSVSMVLSNSDGSFLRYGTLRLSDSLPFDGTTILVMVMVPLTGIEPVCPIGRQILSLLCIPFHHRGIVKRLMGLRQVPLH